MRIGLFHGGRPVVVATLRPAPAEAAVSVDFYFGVVYHLVAAQFAQVCPLALSLLGNYAGIFNKKKGGKNIQAAGLVGCVKEPDCTRRRRDPENLGIEIINARMLAQKQTPVTGHQEHRICTEADTIQYRSCKCIDISRIALQFLKRFGRGRVYTVSLVPSHFLRD